jgi:hypothetical protein
VSDGDDVPGQKPRPSKDPGDVVDFKIDAQKYVIVDVKLIAHAK